METENGPSVSPAIDFDEDNTDKLLASLATIIGQGEGTVIYSICNDIGQAVKEIQIDGLNARVVETLNNAIKELVCLQHPKLLRYIRVFKHEDYFYLYMVRYPQSLDAFLRIHKREKKMPAREVAISMIHQITAALVYLHDPNKTDKDGRPLPTIVHGGIKPANILLNEDATQFVLSDTGICQEAVYARTSAYTAPEVIMGGRPTPASDMWSLGTVLYELATGSKPSFLGGKDPKDVFAQGWKPDLASVSDKSAKSLIEKLLVIEQDGRASASTIAEVFTSNMELLTIIQASSIQSLQDKFARMQTMYSELEAQQKKAVETLRMELEAKYQEKINILQAKLTEKHGAETNRLREELASNHKKDIDKLRSELLSACKSEIEELKQQLAGKIERESASASTKVAEIPTSGHTSMKDDTVKKIVICLPSDPPATQSGQSSANTSTSTTINGGTPLIEAAIKGDVHGGGR